jgi:hypothetical protein
VFPRYEPLFETITCVRASGVAVARSDKRSYDDRVHVRHSTTYEVTVKKARRAPGWVAATRLALLAVFIVDINWVIWNADHMRPIGMLPFAVLGLVLLCGALWLHRMYPEKKPPAATALLSKGDPRWRANSVTQLAGATCVECGEKIVMETRACACTDCEQPLHRKACSQKHQARVHRAGTEGAYR